MAIRASHICSSLLFACAMGTADAAELGEAQLRSWLGQPLAASVELTALEDAAAAVGVRLAHPDVYRGANIAMPAVLSGLSLAVTRQGGRQFLHLSTIKPVESRHLHVYLELLDGGRRTVRLVTLWLAPDPNPAPPVPVAAPAQAPDAPDAPPRASASAARPAAALNEGEEYVEAGARRAPVVARQPAVRTLAAPARPAPARKAPPAAAPALPAAAREAPAACAAQPAPAQLNACAALGERNAALRHELGQLEAKVQGLQAAAGVAPAAAPAPKGAPRILTPRKAPAPPAPETPWGLIGGALAAGLALAGLAVALLRRRRPSTFGKIPKEHKPAKLQKVGTASAPDAADGAPKPSFMSAVKARLMPGKRQPAPPGPVEPALEGAGNQPGRGAHESVYTS